MKKIYLSLTIFLLSVFCVYSQGSMRLGLGNATFPYMEYRVDTLAHIKVGPGTHYLALRLVEINYPDNRAPRHQNVFFLIADLANPHLEVRQVLGRDSLYGTERPTVMARRKTTPGNFYFAGINGDFFDTFTGDPQRPAGRPVGGNIVNSQIAQIPNTWRHFAVDERGIPDIGQMIYSGSVTFGGSTRAINNVNHRRGENALVLFNSTYGRVTQTNPYGTEVQIELLPGETWGINRPVRARVTGEPVSNVGNMWIPTGQGVLSGHGTAAAWLRELSDGDEVEINLSMIMNGNDWAWAQMTGGEGRPAMLMNGVLETGNVWNELHPRTGIGFSQARDTLIMTVVDGRRGTTGVNTLHLAQIMQTAGAWTALNLDGGGSSTLIAEPFGQLNVPADGTERASGNSVFLVSTAPESNEIAMIIPHTPVINIPVHSEFVPLFFGYNRYGVLISIDFQNAVLSVPASLGRIEGNKFIAGGNTESGIITASYNGATAEIQVNFVPASDIAIRLESIIADNRTDYTIEVMASTAYGVSPISPLALTWTVENPEILEVVNGQIRALTNGVTTVTGTMDGITRQMQVSVEIPESAVMRAPGIELENWTMTANRYPTAVLNEENLPENWDTGIAVNFIHQSGAAPSISLRNSLPLFGLPDTVKIVLNIGDIALANTNPVSVSLRANNAAQNTVHRPTNLPANQDFSIVMAMDDMFDTADRAVYPIWFENINFNIRTGGMTIGRAYTLAVKEIRLVFAGFLQTNIPIVNARPSFFVFPNPAAHGMLNLVLSENTGQTVRTEIFNLQGQLVSSETHGTFSGAPLSLSIHNLPAGTYLLRVFENEQVGTMQFIVK